MDNLEFELSSVSGIKYDTEPNSVGVQKKEADEKSMIEFSAKLIDFFKNESKKYNKSNPSKKTSSKKLKEAYIEAANFYQEDYPFNKNHWCIAKVFLYLDIKKGKKILIDDSYANIDFKNEINISLEWAPTEEHLRAAALVIKEKELEYDFKSIDDLYLENYKPLDLEWE